MVERNDWTLNFDSLPSVEDDVGIVDVIAENAFTDDDERKPFETGSTASLKPSERTNIHRFTDVPMESVDNKMILSLENKTFTANKLISEYAVNSYDRWRDYSGLKFMSMSTDVGEETELTRELKAKVRAVDKRNLDLIIEVEKLKTELDRQRNLFNDLKMEMECKVRERRNEVKNLKRLNVELQINLEDARRAICDKVTKLQEFDDAFKALKEDFERAIDERNQTAEQLEIVKSESSNAVRECRMQSQKLSYNELSLSRCENENEILKEKLKFSESTVKELSTKIETMKSEIEQTKSTHREEMEKTNQIIGKLKANVESVEMARNEINLRQSSALKMLRSSEEKNDNLQKSLEIAGEKEASLSRQLADALFKGKVSKDELATVRKELSNVQNKMNKKEEECTRIGNELKEAKSGVDRMENELKKSKEVVDELRKDNHDLKQVKENSEIKLITLENCSECLKKENSRLEEELAVLKGSEEKLKQELLDLEKVGLSREAKLVNVEALNEVLCSIYRNIPKGNSLSSDPSTLPGSWFKEDNWARKCGVVGKMSELEINKAENESKISNLLSMLSNYRDAFHMMYASQDGGPPPHFEYGGLFSQNGRTLSQFEYLQKPVGQCGVGMTNYDAFRRFAEFESLYKNVKATYENKFALLRRQEELLKKDVEQLEKALMVSRKNEMRLRSQLDGQTSSPKEASSKTSKLQDCILELEARERRLNRRIKELLLAEEYLVKNSNSLKNSSHDDNEHFKRLPPERDLPQGLPRSRTVRFQDDKRPKHPLDWIDLHATISNDLYREAYIFEKTRHLRDKEIDLTKKLCSAEEECRKCHDKIVEDQQTIHQMKLQSRRLEISEESLKQQLMLAEERESKLAKKVCHLAEKVATLENSLRNSVSCEESLRVEVSNFKAREDELQMQVTRAYDELHDNAVQEANLKKSIRELEEMIGKYESNESTSKLIEEQFKITLEESKINEANLKDKLASKKKSLKSISHELEIKAEECIKLEKSVVAIRNELQDKNEELNIMKDKIKLLETDNINRGSQYDSLLKILEHHKQEFQSKLEEKKSELESLHKSFFEVKRDFIEKEKENEALKHNIREMRHSNVQLKDSLDDLEERFLGCEAKNSELDSNLNASVDYSKHLKDELETLSKKLKSSEMTREVLGSKLIAEQNKVINLERENENLKVDLKVVKEENNALEVAVDNLNDRSKEKETEVLEREEKFWEDLRVASKREDELKRKVAELEETNQAGMIETLRNVYHNSKDIQVDFSLKSMMTKLTQEDMLYVVENHHDFRRVANILSVKYPGIHKDFMDNMKALIGGKRLEEDKRQSEVKNDQEHLGREFYNFPAQKIKSNPLYCKRMEMDQNNDTDVEDITTEPELSESGLSPTPALSQPTKSFPLQFSPKFHQSRQFGQAFHKFWPMPINEVKEDAQIRQVDKEESKSKKKVTYQEQKTTYVRSRHLSTPVGPLFKTSYVDSQAAYPRAESTDKSKDISKAQPRNANELGSKERLLVLKESSVDRDDDDAVVENESSISKNDEMQDVYEENIVQKRIALFENKS